MNEPTTATGPPVATGRRPAWVTLALVCVSVTLFPISLTGGAIAAPDIAHALHPSLSSVAWVVNAYNLTFAAFMLAAGALGDLVGRRRVFRLGTALFGLGLLVATLSSSIVLIDLARAAAGIGAAAGLTNGAALLAARFEDGERVRAFGLFGTGLGAGLALGPLVGGALVDAFGWRGVFAVPAAIGLAVAAGSFLLEDSRNPDARSVDWAGTVTFTGGLFLLVLGLVEAPSHGWGSTLVVLCLTGFVALMTTFVVAEHRQEAPMFDLELLRYRRFVGVLFTAVAVAVALLPVLLFLPTYLSAVDDFSAVHAGAILLLFTVPTLAVPMMAGPLAKVMHLRTQLATALAIIAAGSIWLTVIEPHVALGTLAGPLIVMGIGIGLTLAVLDGAALSSVDLSRVGMASGMFNTVRLTADTASAAVAGSLLLSLTASKLAGQVPDPHGAADAVNTGLYTTSAAIGGAYSDSLHVMLWVAAAFAIVTIPILLATIRRDEPEVPAHDEVVEGHEHHAEELQPVGGH
jgi:MFS family permease